MKNNATLIPGILSKLMLLMRSIRFVGISLILGACSTAGTVDATGLLVTPGFIDTLEPISFL